jgi:hypothetical protein
MNVNVAGADVAGTNTSGNNWAPAVQLSTQRCKVYGLVVWVREAVAADRTVYLFDTAAGNSSSVAPKVALTVGYGLTGALDLGSGGIPFNDGLYVVVATDEVADAATAPTAGSNNDALVTVGLRKF